MLAQRASSSACCRFRGLVAGASAVAAVAAAGVSVVGPFFVLCWVFPFVFSAAKIIHIQETHLLHGCTRQQQKEGGKDERDGLSNCCGHVKKKASVGPVVVTCEI